MLKRGLIFFLIMLCLPILYLKVRDLELNYFVLAPLFIFPLYFLYFERGRYSFYAAAAIVGAVSVYFFFKMPSFDLAIFQAGQAALFGSLVLYEKRWTRRLEAETRVNEQLLHACEMLKGKYEHRLQNLHTLEKQVTSLMDLFEIARDFTDAMQDETLVDLLQKRVLPELPFKKMRLVFPRAAEGETPAYRIFTVEPDTETRLTGGPLPAQEERMARAASKDLGLVREDPLWVFPLVLDKQAVAFLTVEGADVTDLAKFEVLAAHLVLQIKKIRLYETVRELSIIDGLTQVFVRRHFVELFTSELRRSLRNRLPLSLLMLDIDHFKRYNDDFGHLVGDATLKEVASVLRANLRKIDIVARYGGEEFIIAVPETGPEGAQEIAERIRSNIARHIFKVYHATTRVTVSIGIAVFPDDMAAEGLTDIGDATVKDMIEKSDAALYQAKEEGRNRVVPYQQISRG